MEEELKKLTKEELLSMVEEFEHYPSVTEDDDKDYILSYLKDESCTISEKEIAEYLLKNGVEINKDNIHLYYEFMDEDDLTNNKTILHSIFNERCTCISRTLDLGMSDDLIMDEYTDDKWTYHIGLKSFEIKDTLKPLHDYIEEIKESDGYKNYVAENSLTNDTSLDEAKQLVEKHNTPAAILQPK